MRAGMILVVGLALLPAHSVSAQDLRGYMVEMDQRIIDLEARVERLEQERDRQIEAKREAEAQKEQAAIGQQIANCLAYRSNPAEVRMYKICAKRKDSQPIRPECLTAELDEMSCEGLRAAPMPSPTK